ncbi:hypothetical protein [Micromonospora fulviviridis]|uniref:hypothetical protein n=1 Tax=Micromonospora fulviviridis TaxID=47860 RepID=UPI00378FCE94
MQAALINGQAMVASAEIQAKSSRSTALISTVGAVVVALVAGLCGVTNTAVTALPDVLTRPGSVTTTAGPTPTRVPGTPDTTQAIGLEQWLDKIEQDDGKVLLEDCLSYSDEDQRRHCWNERLRALGMTGKERAALLSVRGPLTGGMARIS